jgi:hypothetical protein
MTEAKQEGSRRGAPAGPRHDGGGKEASGAEARRRTAVGGDPQAQAATARRALELLRADACPERLAPPYLVGRPKTGQRSAAATRSVGAARAGDDPRLGAMARPAQTSPRSTRPLAGVVSLRGRDGREAEAVPVRNPCFLAQPCPLGGPRAEGNERDDGDGREAGEQAPERPPRFSCSFFDRNVQEFPFDLDPPRGESRHDHGRHERRLVADRRARHQGVNQQS